MRWRWNVIALCLCLFAVGFALGVSAGTGIVVQAAENYFPDLHP